MATTSQIVTLPAEEFVVSSVCLPLDSALPGAPGESSTSAAKQEHGGPRSIQGGNSREGGELAAAGIAQPGTITSGEATPKPHSRGAVALIMTPLCLSVILSSLDLTIVTPAIPSIAGEFQSGSSGYIWIGSAFILSYTAITPIWGSVADIWGRKPVILAALSLFLAGSLLCALSSTIKSLIGGRAVQGLGASGMGTMVNVVICDTFSLRDRPLYLAISSIVWAVGSAVGPVIGGAFTTQLSWRWCFWINLPIGAVVFGVLFFFLDVPNPKTPVLLGLKAIDWAGSSLIIGGTLMVLLALTFGGVTYPWSSVAVINLIIFGTVVFGIFIINEWKLASNPVIPLRLFTNRSTVAAYGLFAFNSYVFLGLAYYLPLYSQSVLGADAEMSGVYLVPLIVSCSLAAALSGVFIQKTGKYLPVMYAAQIFLTLGVGLLINLDYEKNLTKLLIFQILAGIGTGMNIEGPLLAAQAATTVLDTAAVVATMSFGRSIATSVSVVVGGVIFQNEMDARFGDLVDKLGQAVAGNFSGDQASANVDLILDLSDSQQDIVRRTYFASLRTVWIMV
ncbi:uncharacterized protein MKZ38_005025 [Zalerion maritima]|uniref:Major facilitator superfamily (MFS) profile domain-containing protein n=1 Tax=Zalerion maritima TaxID=339359 RepID=A0AAD5WQK0_9PEZI|nr:uncharacterized protein MKZ38_005025 [Zalerion maritima]